MVLGVAGKYCAGKDAVVARLRGRGFHEINEDTIGHEALEVKREEVEAAFGTADRKELGAIVFADSDALRRLESIVHPWMVEETRRRVMEREEAAPGSHVVVNAAILHRMRLHLLCDAVLLVEAPVCVRILRGLRRDKLGLRRTLSRIWSQRRDDIPYQFLNEKGARVDTHRVKNGGSIGSLDDRIGDVVSKLE